MMIGKNQLVKKHLSYGFYYFVKKLQFFSLNDVNYHFCKVKRCLFSFINQIAILFICFRNTIDINIRKKNTNHVDLHLQLQDSQTHILT